MNIDVNLSASVTSRKLEKKKKQCFVNAYLRRFVKNFSSGKL